MTGGFSRPRRDAELKVTEGQTIKTGQILARNYNLYKAGVNVKGRDTIFALCPGEVYFTRKKTSHGKVRTFINVKPQEKKTAA
jgi:ribosomal protein L27